MDSNIRTYCIFSPGNDKLIHHLKNGCFECLPLVSKENALQRLVVFNILPDDAMRIAQRFQLEYHAHTFSENAVESNPLLKTACERFNAIINNAKAKSDKYNSLYARFLNESLDETKTGKWRYENRALIYISI